MPDHKRSIPPLALVWDRKRHHEQIVQKFLTAAALEQNQRVRHYIESVRLHPDETTGGKPTAICYAAMKANPDLLRYLLDQGASANVRDALGMSPLHYAAMGGCEVCVAVLIQHNARSEARNHSGETPLDLTKRQPRLAQCRAYLASHYQAAKLDQNGRARRHFH